VDMGSNANHEVRGAIESPYLEWGTLMQIITQIFNINTVQNLAKRHFKQEKSFFSWEGARPSPDPDKPSGSASAPPEF